MDTKTTIGEMCHNCGCFHDDAYAEKHPQEAEALREICKIFDPATPCRFCELPVGTLSLGGPDICPQCDSGYKQSLLFGSNIR